jgi:integrase
MRHKHTGTLSDAIGQFISRSFSALPQTSRTRQAVILDRFSKFFGENARIESITTSDVRRFVQHRSNSIAPASISHELNLLSKIFDIGVEAGTLKMNPVDDVGTRSHQRSAPRFLTKTEFTRVMEASPDWLREILKFSTATGLTQSEILKVRFSDIEGHDHEALLCVRTGRKVRKVPLNKMARAVLGQMQEGSTSRNDLVFKGESINAINISQAFRRASGSIAPGLTFRQLRYSAAKWMSEGGAPLHAIAAYLGHRTTRMTERLFRPSAESLADDLGMIDRYLAIPKFGRRLKKH